MEYVSRPKSMSFLNWLKIFLKASWNHGQSIPKFPWKTNHSKWQRNRSDLERWWKHLLCRTKTPFSSSGRSWQFGDLARGTQHFHRFVESHSWKKFSVRLKYFLGCTLGYQINVEKFIQLSEQITVPAFYYVSPESGFGDYFLLPSYRAQIFQQKGTKFLDLAYQKLSA